MEPRSPKEIFLDSFQRCTASEEFIPAFYERFLTASPEIREKFEHTDFEHQHRMLRNSLRLSAGATSGDLEAMQELKARAETHNRDHLDIPPHLYRYWLEAILGTAQEFDPEWDDETEAAWQRILGHIVKFMASHYES